MEVKAYPETTQVDQNQEKESKLYESLKTRPRPELESDMDKPQESGAQEPGNISSEHHNASQPTWSFEEALEASTRYFRGDSLAANVWISKYALKNSAGDLFERTPDDMHRRLAREIARIESRYPNPMSEDLVFHLLRDFRYIVPQGSPMAGIGNDFQIGSLSNCFVIGHDGPSDSYGAIMKTDQEQVQLMKRRGGVGHDLSHIRPKGSPVKNSALTSTGIVPFMERFSNSTREVAQDGRRGALMLSISIKHPDAEHFIDAKLEQGKVTGANVSVKITHEFMEAVRSDSEFVQQYPIDSPSPQYTRTIRARELWNKIIHNAWKSAEPGILFWDTIIRESVPDCYADMGFRTVSTNPCGEIPLCPYDSCRLLAINLLNYVENPFTPQAKFNTALFREHVHYAQRMMDNIVDMEIEKVDRILDKINRDPEEEELKRVERNLWMNIRQKGLEGRRTGLGITAEGDMLAALGLRYGSEEAIDFTVNIHKTLAIEAYRASVTMARERGPFPVFSYQKEADNPMIRRIAEADPGLYEEMKTYGRRNIALLTIAPTGTTSLMTQTTSGIEPAFQVVYKRRRKVNPNDKNVTITFTDQVGDAWEEYVVLHHQFINWLEINGYDPDAVVKLPEDELDAIVAKSPYYKATANDIDWLAKVKMQGAVQKWVDHSISVTVNVPERTTKELVGQIYLSAWESGCKGVTVYRDGSRDGVLISSKEKSQETGFSETKAPRRPARLEAEIVRFSNQEEKWIAVVGLYEGRPYEIFTGNADHFWIPAWVEKGWVIKSRNEEGVSRYDFQFEDHDGYRITIEGLSRSFNKEYWNYAKLISGILRHGMPLHFAVDIISKLNFEADTINNWKFGLERALKKFIPDGTPVKKSQCPNCGEEGTSQYMEGCLTCSNCGYSKCG
ncbi:MAG: adenosylcobalamin-dependent ribonucleoside-diphosphate reductase [Bacteroidales bacterium]